MDSFVLLLILNFEDFCSLHNRIMCMVFPLCSPRFGLSVWLCVQSVLAEVQSRQPRLNVQFGWASGCTPPPDEAGGLQVAVIVQAAGWVSQSGKCYFCVNRKENECSRHGKPDWCAPNQTVFFPSCFNVVPAQFQSWSSSNMWKMRQKRSFWITPFLEEKWVSIFCPSFQSLCLFPGVSLLCCAVI